MGSLSKHLRNLALGCASVALAHGAAWAQTEERVHIDIPAQSLSSALAEFGRQANIEIAFTPDAVRSLRASNVEGVLSRDDALTRLLAGSGLTYRRSSEGAYVVQAQDTHSSPTQLGDAGRAAPSDTGAPTEEVIVTARRRSESVQNVPGAVTALSGTALEQVHATGFDDFVRMAPGLTMGDTGIGGLRVFNMRGIKTAPGIAPTQAPVTLYIDEMPTSDPYYPYGSVDLYLADIDHVEVLRGPQGTLFGSGSLSGAIRVLTRKPELGVFSGYLEGSADSVEGGGSGGGVEGVLNVPLGDRFAVRGLMFYREAPGYIDNVARHQDDVNSGIQSGGRLALRGEVTDALTVTASVLYQRDHFDDGPKSFVDGYGGSREWGSLTPDIRTDEATIANLVADYDFGWATLTSSTSYLNKDDNVNTNADSVAALLGFPGTPAFSPTQSGSDAWVQELRLTSQLHGPLSYVVGAYYSRWDHSVFGVARAPAVEATFFIPDLIESTIDSRIQETALYADLSWRVTDTVELTAGVRTAHDEFNSHQHIEGLLNGFAVTDFSTHTTDSPVTPRFTATWRPTNELTLYAQAAKGYRIGQTNIQAPGVPPTFGPDSLWNYELGVKSTFWGGRARVNAAAYYIDWQNLQVGLPGPLGPYVANAGSAKSVGLELETAFKLTENLEFSTSAAWTDAELTEDVPTLVQPSGVIGASSGDKLPATPDFTMTNALEYTRHLGDGASFFVRVDHQFVGGSINSFTAVNADHLGDYHIFNASAGLDFANGLHLGAFIKNIADDDGTANVTFDPVGGPIHIATRVPPRTIGVSLRKDF